MRILRSICALAGVALVPVAFAQDAPITREGPNHWVRTINETIATIPVGGRVIYSISGRVRPCQTGCGVSITNIAALGTGETSTDVDGQIMENRAKASLNLAF